MSWEDYETEIYAEIRRKQFAAKIAKLITTYRSPVTGRGADETWPGAVPLAMYIAQGLAAA